MNKNKSDVLWSSVFLELTSHCNFSCSFCPSDRMARKKSRMEKKRWETIIKELGTKRLCRMLCFHVLGEPLLHTDLFDAIRMANSYGIWVSLYTNGALLGRKNCERLLRSISYGEVKISLQQADPDKFGARSHARLTWEEYVDRICDFIVDADRNYPPLPVQLHYMVDIRSIGWNMSRLYRQSKKVRNVYDYFAKRISKHRGKRLRMDIMNPVASYPLGDVSNFYIKHLRNWDNQMVDPKHVVKPKKNGVSCDLMNNTFAILSDGTCTFCCNDFEGSLNLGNANEKSLEDIFYGKKSKILRRAEKKGAMLAKRCQLCKGRLYDRKSGRAVEARLYPVDLFLTLDHFHRYGFASTIRKAMARIR